VAVVLGVGLMYAAAIPVASLLGTRPALVISEAALLLPGLGLLVLLERPFSEALALRGVGGRLALLSVLCGASLWALSLGIFQLQYVVWPPPEGYLEGFRRLHEALRPTGPVDALVSIAAIALIPAACEEALFRGIVVGALAPLGRAAAVIASAVLFGLIHLDLSATGVPAFYRTPFAIVVGSVLAALRLRTASLIPAVLAHATLNFITFTVAPWVDDPGPGAPPAQPLLGAALLFGGGAMTLGLLARMRAGPSVGSTLDS
jgi:membrane protease YdiL (CAAX protease family)